MNQRYYSVKYPGLCREKSLKIKKYAINEIFCNYIDIVQKLYKINAYIRMYFQFLIYDPIRI